jgi:hypothetical protein
MKLTAWKITLTTLTLLAAASAGCDLPPEQGNEPPSSEAVETTEDQLSRPLPGPFPPVICTRELNPVCGGDGQEYFNECEATAHGQKVVGKPPCQPPANPGCDSNADCAADGYCKKAFGQCSARGTCAARPRFCAVGFPISMCGCDGRTYKSECEAARAGVSLAGFGRCRLDPGPIPVWR